MKTKTSSVWLHFSIINDSKAQCDICKTELSYKGCAISNLKKHLKCKHPTVILEESRFKPKTINRVKENEVQGEEGEPEATSAFTSATTEKPQADRIILATLRNKNNSPLKRKRQS